MWKINIESARDVLSLNLTEYALNSISDLNNEQKSNLIRSLADRFLCIFSAITSKNNVEFFSGNYQNMTKSLFNTLKLFATMSAQTFIKTLNKICSSIVSDNIQLTVQEIDIKLNSTYFNIISECNQTDSTTFEGNSISFPPSPFSIGTHNWVCRVVQQHTWSNINQLLSRLVWGIRTCQHTRDGRTGH